MATSDKDKPNGATGVPASQAQTPSALVAGLSPEERRAFMKMLVEADAPPPPKPVLKKKFRVVAVRLGFDGLTLRHPGRKFSMEINVNDDWPDWVVKEEDYVPPPKDEDVEDEEGVAQRVQVRGGVKAGNQSVQL
ncbi:MAG: hypothetical protein JWL97_2973 [Gemmatimonadales bacterium]|nr:hypothetical protein [Gemmatimonadales bacterium]